MDPRRQGFGGVGLAVDEEGVLEGAGVGPDEGFQSGAVRVGGKPVHLEDLRPQQHGPAVDADLLDLLGAVLEDAAPQRVLGLIAHEEDRVAFVGSVVEQVVKDPAVLAHAARRDDDGGALEVVEPLGLVGGADRVEQVETEGVALRPGARLVAFRMAPIHLGDVGRERAVDVDRNPRDPALQALEAVGQVLRASHREGGDEDLPPAAGDLVDDGREVLLLVLLGGMDAVPVGALHEDRVCAREQLGAPEDRQRRPSDVAREDDPLSLGLELHQRRAEHVAGVVEGHVHVRGGLEDLVIGHGLDQRGGGSRVVAAVERLPRRALALVDELHVALLDGGRVEEHQRGQIGGGRGRVDGAGPAGLHERGKGARMVDVGVGEDDRVDGLHVEAEDAVALEGFFSRPLVESAVEEDRSVAGFQEVAAAGDAPGGAVEVELHWMWRL